MGTHSFIKSRLTSPIMSIMPITKNRITQNRNIKGIAHNMILPNADILLLRIRRPKISKMPPKIKNSSILQNVIANRIQHGEKQSPKTTTDGLNKQKYHKKECSNNHMFTSFYLLAVIQGAKILGTKA